MGTFEADRDRIFRLQYPNEAPRLGLGFSSSSRSVEEELMEKLENVVLESELDGRRNAEEYGGSSHLFPLRPYAEDCPYYLRTGTCKFGITCRFNHPMKKGNQVDAKLSDWRPENHGKAECKYYLTPSGCKYGNFCRFSHSKDESEALPKLNIFGLPLRDGEKECPYYLRCGTCGYGARCVFHHPEPDSMGIFNLDDKPMTQSGYSFGSSSSEPASLLLTGKEQPDPAAQWASYPDHLPYEDDTTYFNMNSFPYGIHRHSASNQYQVPDVPLWNYGPAYLPPGSRASVPDASVQLEEYLQRPGQPVCAYFLKTGDCKFKFTCRFHHPKEWVHKGGDICALNDKGLPLRPGKMVCRYYDRYGICKFGRACVFDHPMNVSTYPVQSVPEPASSHGTGPWTN